MEWVWWLISRKCLDLGAYVAFHVQSSHFQIPQATGFPDLQLIRILIWVENSNTYMSFYTYFRSCWLKQIIVAVVNKSVHSKRSTYSLRCIQIQIHTLVKCILRPVYENIYQIFLKVFIFCLFLWTYPFLYPCGLNLHLV